ncbi:uncharacterized protein [Euwallacea fornicatus]|uniref:uncharacterized protein n=1 Tax=Euwallacea fornicatus TaxID=995702 RepID=UPI00338FE51B
MFSLKLRVTEALCFLVLVSLGDAVPKSRSSYYYPKSYMVGGSFYANPRFARDGHPTLEYITPGQMTAMVVGDTVATNSFSGPTFVPSRAIVPAVPNQYNEASQEQFSAQTTERQQFLPSISEPDTINETEPESIFSEFSEPNSSKGSEQETLFSIEEITTEAAIAPTTKAPIITTTKAPSGVRKVKIGRARRPTATTSAPAQPEEEQDDTSLPASWPFLGSGKNGAPAYNAFFPVFINGGSPSGRSQTRSNGAQEETYPGSATAIANAFSTGKGGVATSHATAFGDPYAAAMLRNSGLFNIETKSTRKLPVAVEE